MKYKLKSYFFTTIMYLILVIMLVVILFPLLVTVMSAFNATNTLYSTTLIPEMFTLFGNFQRLFEETTYLNWYLNTFILAFGTMFLASTFITVAGFIYSRFRFQGRKTGLIFLFLIQIIPTGSTIIALYAIANAVGIYNSEHSQQLIYLYLILIYTAGSIPMNTLLMKGYYDSIPRELDESARMDGASNVKIFKEILIPLVKPMIAVVALFSFMGPIGDIIMPSILNAGGGMDSKTLAIGLNALIADPTDQSYNLFAAGSILVAIPAILLFWKLQKYLIGGLTSGGVKG